MCACDAAVASSVQHMVAMPNFQVSIAIAASAALLPLPHCCSCTDSCCCTFVTVQVPSMPNPNSMRSPATKLALCAATLLVASLLQAPAVTAGKFQGTSGTCKQAHAPGDFSIYRILALKQACTRHRLRVVT